MTKDEIKALAKRLREFEQTSRTLLRGQLINRDGGEAADALLTLSTERDMLAAKVAELEGALKPFARAYEWSIEEQPLDVQAIQRMRAYVGFDHFCKAARTQAPTEGAPTMTEQLSEEDAALIERVRKQVDLPQSVSLIAIDGRTVKALLNAAREEGAIRALSAERDKLRFDVETYTTEGA